MTATHRSTRRSTDARLIAALGSGENALAGAIPVPVAPAGRCSVTARSIAELEGFLFWGYTGGANLMIGECGVPSRGPDVEEWSAVWEAWWKIIDENSTPVWVMAWGTEFGDPDQPFDHTYASTEYTDNPYNLMSVYNPVPLGGTKLGPIGRMTRTSHVLERHLQAKTLNRYGVNIDAGSWGYFSAEMFAGFLGRTAPYNPGPVHDYAGASSAQMKEYSYGSLKAPAGMMTTPAYLGARGVGIARQMVHWERIQPTLNGALNATEVQRLKDAIAAFHAAGVETILNIHNYGLYFQTETVGTIANSIGDGTLTQAHFVDLWTKIATAFVGTPGLVGYGLMNEPAFVGSTALWESCSQAAFNAIKAIDTATTVIVNLGGGGSYGGVQDCFTDHPAGPWITGDTHGQIRYDGHHYFDRTGSFYQATVGTSYLANRQHAYTHGYFAYDPVPGEMIGRASISPATPLVQTISTFDTWQAIVPSDLDVTIHSAPASGAARLRLTLTMNLAATLTAGGAVAALFSYDTGGALTPASGYDTAWKLLATDDVTNDYETAVIEHEIGGLNPGQSYTLRPIWLLSNNAAGTWAASLTALIGQFTSWSTDLNCAATVEVFAI